MALPASGQITYGDIRTETQTTGRNNYSAAKAAWTSGSSNLVEYPAINMGSTSRPDTLQPASASEWYSYNHSAFSSCPSTVTNLGNRGKPQTPYADFYVVDVGTTSGNVNWSIAIASGSANGASVAAEYGYPWNSSGSYVGGAGGTLFSTGLINSATSGSATYTYNAAYGSKIYISIDAIQSSTSWPIFDVTIPCPTGFTVQLYAKAGDTITSGDEFNVYYSTDDITYTFIAGPLNSTSCTTLSTVNIPSTLYIELRRDSDGSPIYFNASNSSTCPSNLDNYCNYSLAITGNTDVALTAYVLSGDFSNCP